MVAGVAVVVRGPVAAAGARLGRGLGERLCEGRSARLLPPLLDGSHSLTQRLQALVGK